MSVKISNLESQIQYLNQITGNPEQTWIRVDGQNIAQIGNYHLEGAYGGWNLAQIVNIHGAITNPLGGGFCSKTELYAKINAFIIGIIIGIEVSKKKKE